MSSKHVACFVHPLTFQQHMSLLFFRTVHFSLLQANICERGRDGVVMWCVRVGGGGLCGVHVFVWMWGVCMGVLHACIHEK